MALGAPRPFSKAFDAHHNWFGWQMYTAATVALPVLDELDEAFPAATNVAMCSGSCIGFDSPRLGPNCRAHVILRSPTMEEFATGFEYWVHVERIRKRSPSWLASCCGPEASTATFTIKSLADITPAFVAAHFKDE